VSRTFLKTKEDFICQVCGEEVKGDGFTDHCPNCLWGKHVDISPGDRLSDCKGLMEPIEIDKKGDKWRILYLCQECGYKHWNKTSPNDSFKKIVELSKEVV